MSINVGDKIKWADIAALYSNLNAATREETGSGYRKKFGGRQLFGFENVTNPISQGDIVFDSHINILNSFLTEMNSNKYLSGLGMSNVTAKNIIYADEIQRISNDIKTINDTCVFDSSFNSTFRSTFDSTFRSTFDSTFRSTFDSNFRSAVNYSCYGVCWGVCFVRDGNVSCFIWEGGTGCTDFGCSEKT